MGQEGDRRHRATGRGRDGRQQRGVIGQPDLLGADRAQLLLKEMEQIELLLGTWCGGRRLISLGVDPAIPDQPLLKLAPKC